MEKKIKNFKNFVNENKSNKEVEETNESWRQAKAWLKIPQILIERLVGLITGYVSELGFKYDQLSANIDIGSSGTATTIKHDPKKLTLDDIENKRLRNSLKISGIFNSWNVYYMYTIDPDRKFNREDNSREVLYITKDELQKGDKIRSERLSERKFNKDIYDKRKKKDRQRKGIKVSDIEPQLFVVAALETEEHDKMRDERNYRYTKKKSKELEKLVDKKIREDDVLGRVNSVFGFEPIVFRVVKEDRIDLMKKLIHSAYDEKELKTMLTMVIDDEGWVVPEKRKYDNDEDLMDVVKSDEMRKLITTTLSGLNVENED